MDGRLPAIKVLAATKVRNTLGRLLNRVARGEETMIVEKDGVPVAVILNLRDYEHYRRLLAQETLVDLGRKIGATAARQNVTEQEIHEEVAAARRALFAERYG